GDAAVGLEDGDVGEDRIRCTTGVERGVGRTAQGLVDGCGEVLSRAVDCVGRADAGGEGAAGREQVDGDDPGCAGGAGGHHGGQAHGAGPGDDDVVACGDAQRVQDAAGAGLQGAAETGDDHGVEVVRDDD